jgi:hypothetical protein
MQEFTGVSGAVLAWGASKLSGLVLPMVSEVIMISEASQIFPVFQ